MSEIYTSELFQFVQDHLHEDPAQLLLKHRQSDRFDLKEAVVQITARQKASSKLPEWIADTAVIFPPALSLEQSSSELTATFKSRFIQGKKLVDLTGGFGVDTFYLGKRFEQVTYVERQERLAAIAKHNFLRLSERSKRYQVYCGDSMDFLKATTEKFDCIYMDPARRGSHNQKLYKLADCEPDILGNWELLTRKADHIMVKTSPMLDIKEVLRELPGLSEIHVVAVKNEVKEMLLIWDKNSAFSTKISAWNLPQEASFNFDFKEEASISAAFGFPEKYLILPSAAILKAGAFKSFSKRYGLNKLHTNTHLYTAPLLSSQISSSFPGRVFEVLEEVKMDKKTVKKHFPFGLANILSRNYPMKPDMIKKKFRLKDGGEDYLIACTVLDGTPKAYRCKRV